MASPGKRLFRSSPRTPSSKPHKTPPALRPLLQEATPHLPPDTASTAANPQASPPSPLSAQHYPLSRLHPPPAPRRPRRIQQHKATQPRLPSNSSRSTSAPICPPLPAEPDSSRTPPAAEPVSTAFGA